ncbi:hypothetical protein P872_14490 [Rhodonellum psychrophilum GCM71 = DSM 17998]|uniref:Uncharacterized protein n=1 Tax=Rhodonellum psychrophilum GCM71 = DSM 17998 TaxID=1123057 RepID=U5BIB0_9BACT|nr:hypothetical protein P872_14490 [Rhodonellum psychrophilum GCM71 = DSM 17998]
MFNAESAKYLGKVSKVFLWFLKLVGFRKIRANPCFFFAFFAKTSADFARNYFNTQNAKRFAWIKKLPGKGFADDL